MQDGYEEGQGLPYRSDIPETELTHKPLTGAGCQLGEVAISGFHDLIQDHQGLVDSTLLAQQDGQDMTGLNPYAACVFPE
ncbi:MAG: hypothetical protein ACYCOS_03845 [Sulfobacillus sp.]